MDPTSIEDLLPSWEQERRFAHLAAVVETSSDGIVSKDLDGTIRTWNAGAARIFGYSSEEIVGRNIRTLIPEELLSEEDEILAKLYAGEYIDHYETVRVAKDGTRLQVSLSISPLSDTTGKVVGASKIIRDVTARKRSDAALKAATAKFESVFNQSGLFAAITDTAGTLLEANAVAIEGCGYLRDDVLQRPFWGGPWWTSAADKSRVRMAVASAAAGSVFRETLPYRNAMGALGVIDFAVHPIRDERGEVRFLHATALDVASAAQAAEALRRSEGRFRSLVSIITDVPWTADPAGRFVEPQPAWEAYTGQEPEVYGGDGWMAALHPDDRPRIREAWSLVRDGTAVLALEGRLWHALSADYRYVVVRATAVVGEEGAVTEWVGTCTDVHERTLTEAALRAQEAEEREIALGLQRALLPSRQLDDPRVGCAARYEAGSDRLEVGGDWYDAFTLPDGRIAVTVGDVVGHGLAAAAAMGQMRTALAALAEHAPSAGELLERLDGYLRRSQTTDFATVCYAILDPASGVLEYASAGHPPMLVVAPGGAVTVLDQAQSAPLSGGPARPRRTAATTLEPGSLLVLYSDGLVERRGERLSDGLARLVAAAPALADAPVDAVYDRLVSALGVEHERDDDVAVLALRLRGPGTPLRHVFPSRPEELRALRAAMRRWLAEQALSAQTAGNLLLAVGEAAGNAVEHAYWERSDGEVQVEIALAPDGDIDVVVRDFGSFRPASAGSEEDRGRGTDIMRNLTVAFTRETDATGTTVRFRLATA